MATRNGNGFLKLLGYIYIPIALLCLVLVGWLMYYEIYLKNNTLAFQSAFVGEATYKEDTYFIEVQIYDNVTEIKFNTYVETNLPEQKEDGTFDEKFIYSYGVQFYDEPISSYGSRREGAIFQDRVYREYTLQNCTYYNNHEGLDFAYISGGSQLDQKKEFIWDIEGKLIALQTLGDVWFENRWWCPQYDVVDISALIAENYQSFKSCRTGTSVVMLDLSKYFNLFEQNENGQFINEVQDENILRAWTFVDVKVTKYTNNMIESKQSMFNSYKGDPNWTLDGSESKQLYWMDETVYTITNDDFKYTANGSGYDLSIKGSCIDFLKEFNNVVIDVEINLDAFDTILKINGFSEDPFGELAVNTIEITSTEEKEFRVFEEYQIIANNVTIVSGGGTND